MNYFALPGLMKGYRLKIEQTAPIEAILKVVTSEYRITHNSLVGKSRLTNLVSARHISMYLLRKYTKLRLVDIAGIFQRDHTTVMFAVQQVKNRMSVDVDYRTHVSDIEYQL